MTIIIGGGAIRALPPERPCDKGQAAARAAGRKIVEQANAAADVVRIVRLFISLRGTPRRGPRCSRFTGHMYPDADFAIVPRGGDGSSSPSARHRFAGLDTDGKAAARATGGRYDRGASDSRRVVSRAIDVAAQFHRHKVARRTTPQFRLSECGDAFPSPPEIGHRVAAPKHPRIALPDDPSLVDCRLPQSRAGECLRNTALAPSTLALASSGRRSRGARRRSPVIVYDDWLARLSIANNFAVKISTGIDAAVREVTSARRLSSSTANRRSLYR